MCTIASSLRPQFLTYLYFHSPKFLTFLLASQFTKNNTTHANTMAFTIQYGVMTPSQDSIPRCRYTFTDNQPYQSPHHTKSLHATPQYRNHWSQIIAQNLYHHQGMQSSKYTHTSMTSLHFTTKESKLNIDLQAYNPNAFHRGTRPYYRFTSL